MELGHLSCFVWGLGWIFDLKRLSHFLETMATEGGTGLVFLICVTDDDYRIRRGWGVVVFHVRFMYVDEFCKGRRTHVALF